MSALRRAFSTIEVKEFDEAKREFEGIATSIGTDRYGDIVESEGAKFALPLPLLWQHQSDKPVGHVLEAKPSKKNIKVKMKLVSIESPGTLKDRLDEAWHSLRTGLVRHLSVGFNPLEYEPIEDSKVYGLRFTSWEWLELSMVTIPANADASITAIKNFDFGLRRAAATGTARSSIRPGVTIIKPPASALADVDGKPIRRDGVKILRLK